jgi:hypothetical protein
MFRRSRFTSLYTAPSHKVHPPKKTPITFSGVVSRPTRSLALAAGSASVSQYKGRGALRAPAPAPALQGESILGAWLTKHAKRLDFAFIAVHRWSLPYLLRQRSADGLTRRRNCPEMASKRQDGKTPSAPHGIMTQMCPSPTPAHTAQDHQKLRAL